MTERQQTLSDNYERVLWNIEAARARRGTGEPVRLLAATKTVPLEDILFLVEKYGLSLCGENRQSEFTQKHEAVQKAGAEMHFIGHLQTNKLKYIVGKTELIHSVDSLHLAEEIDRRSRELGKKTNILVEVNAGEEASKTGLNPGEAAVLLAKLSEEGRFPGLNLRGMMAMVPKSENSEEIHQYFRESYQIFLDFFAKKSHNIGEPILSMGMSDSYEAAIEEGANLVRVGSAIFGARTYHEPR